VARSVYATIADVRATGLDEVQYPDEVVRDKLELAAEIVEAVTQQFFGPRRKRLILDGLGRKTAADPARNKIIETISLEWVGSSNETYLFQDSQYVTLERGVQLRPHDVGSSPFDRAFRAIPENRFTYEYRSVALTAVFGWIDLSDTKHETTLAAPLAKGASSISLVDTGDVEKNDLLLIDGRFWVIANAVTLPSVAEIPEVPEIISPPTPAVPAVPGVPGTVTHDPSPKAAVIGATVVRYGQVPRLLREAVVRTLLVNVVTTGSDDEADQDLRRRLRREETDNYEAEFFAAPNGPKLTAGTGDPRADAILSRFMAPAVSGEWV